MKIEIVPASVTVDLRRRVLRPGWGPERAMPSDSAAGAVHFAALADDGTVLGACLVAPAPYPGCEKPRPGRTDVAPSWQLRGMATEPERRGQGIGGRVLLDAVGYVASHGATLIWCNAREQAIRFYAERGFTGDGGLFVQEETGIPHLRMRRELSGGPGSST